MSTTTLMKKPSAIPNNRRSANIIYKTSRSQCRSIPEPTNKAVVIQDDIEDFLSTADDISYEHEKYYKILIEKLDELFVIEKSPLIREEKAGSIIQVTQLVMALHDLCKASNLFRERIGEYLLIEQESSMYIDIEEIISETATAFEALKQRAKKSQ